MSDERRELPVTPDQAHRGPQPQPQPTAAEVASWRLITTLAVAGALAGLLIVSVYQWAQPQILEYRAGVLIEAIGEVLGGPDRVETLYVQGDGLTAQPPAGIDTVAAEKVYVGYGPGGERMGYAIVGGEPGFQDVIQLIFGYDPLSGQVLGMRVLESKETPGLGDAIIKDMEFVAEFDGVQAPLEGVKESTGAPNEVDMITGATISSQTIVNTINNRLRDLNSVLEGHAGGGL